MKAYVLHSPNDLRMEEVNTPKPKEGEALVRVKAAGICGSDIPRIFQTGAHISPIIPGHEFSGVVEAMDTNNTWINERVGVFPLIPCGKCTQCGKKQYEMCENYDYIGSRRDGAFAEYVTVPEWNLIKLPEGVSFEAAAMLEPMAVAVHAMRGLLGDRIDDKEYMAKTPMLVLGLGTIGLLLTMFLIDAGAKNLYVVGNKEIQVKEILRMGIPKHFYFDGKTQNLSEVLPEKPAVIFECVGRSETVDTSFSIGAPKAEIMLVGNPFSEMMVSRQNYWKILRNQYTIKGTWNSSYTGEEDDDWHYVLRALERGLEPERLITHTCKQDELMKGLEIMRDKTEEYVKIMWGN